MIRNAAVQAHLAAGAGPGLVNYVLGLQISPLGITNPIRFEIGNLPEILETEPNDSTPDAGIVDGLPTVINGRIMPGDVDRFVFSARTVLDWQAVQLWRIEWLLGAIAMFAAGVLLKRRRA